MKIKQKCLIKWDIFEMGHFLGIFIHCEIVLFLKEGLESCHLQQIANRFPFWQFQYWLLGLLLRELWFWNRMVENLECDHDWMSFLLRALLQRYMSEGLKMTSIAVWEQPWIRGWYWGWCECNTPSSYPLSFADGPKAPYKSQQKILLYKFTLIVRAISGLEPGT